MANVSKRTLDFAEIAAAVHKEVGRGTVTEAELAISALKGVLVDLAAEYGAITALGTLRHSG